MFRIRHDDAFSDGVSKLNPRFYRGRVAFLSGKRHPSSQHGQNLLAHRHFPRKKKAAVPVKARSCPLAFSGLQKHRSRWPATACAFAPHASGMLASDREDSKLYLTMFIWWGAELLCMMLLVVTGDD